MLVARFPGRTGQPVVALDGLAQAPGIESLVVSTEIRLSRPLPSVRELLLASVTPLPTAETLTNLPALEILHAPTAMTTRKLAVDAVAPGLAELAAHRGCIADVESVARLRSLRRLHLDLYPGDSVQPLGELTGLVRLRVGGPKVTGWRALAACEQLEEALLDGLASSSLRPFRGWRRLRRLTITRRGLRSLSGIEELAALEELDLRLMGIDDLGPLGALPRLRSLRLVGLQAARDLSPLAGLRTLERLRVSRAGVEESDIVHVESLRPLANLDRLEELDLAGTVVDDGDLTPLTTLPRLRRLTLRAAEGPVVDELLARPGLDVTFEEAPGTAPAVVAHGLPIRTTGDGRWWLRADLAGRLDVETNGDAEGVVRAAVTDRDRELAGRLSFDTEAGSVGISAADPADLRYVAAVIDALARR